MNDGDSDASLGAQVRAAREAVGATVEQVSADTRIRATLIRDIEADRFDSCGGAVYARGHLRAIAGAVGTDAAPLVARFDAEQGRVVPAAPFEADLGPARPASFGGSVFTAPVAGPDRTGPRWGLAVAGAAVVLVGVLAVGYASSPGSARVPAAGGAPASPGPAITRAPVQTPDPGAVAAKPLATGAQLRVRVFGGKSYIGVRDGSAHLLFQGVLTDGQFKDFSDPIRLKIVVGNAGAVDLNCGGQDGGKAGGNGAVRHFDCSDKGLTPTA